MINITVICLPPRQSLPCLGPTVNCLPPGKVFDVDEAPESYDSVRPPDVVVCHHGSTHSRQCHGQGEEGRGTEGGSEETQHSSETKSPKVTAEKRR